MADGQGIRAALLDPEFRQRIRHSLFRLGVGRDAVDDASQDVMMALLTTRAIVEDLETYTSGIARNVARREVQHRVDYRAKYADLDMVGFGCSTGERDVLTTLIRKQRLHRAQRILQSFPARPREILIRAYVHGQGVGEIGQAMALSPGTLRNEKHRAKIQFLERVAAQ